MSPRVTPETESPEIRLRQLRIRVKNINSAHPNKLKIVAARCDQVINNNFGDAPNKNKKIAQDTNLSENSEIPLEDLLGPEIDDDAPEAHDSGLEAGSQLPSSDDEDETEDQDDSEDYYPPDGTSDSELEIEKSPVRTRRKIAIERSEEREKSEESERLRTPERSPSAMSEHSDEERRSVTPERPSSIIRDRSTREVREAVDIMNRLHHINYPGEEVAEPGMSLYETECRRMKLVSPHGRKLPNAAIRQFERLIAEHEGEHYLNEDGYLAGTALFTFERGQYVQMLQHRRGYAVLDAVPGRHTCFEDCTPIRACLMDRPSLRCTFFCRGGMITDGTYVLSCFRTTQDKVFAEGSSLFPLNVVNHKVADCSRHDKNFGLARSRVTMSGKVIVLNGGKVGITNTDQATAEMRRSTSGEREHIFRSSMEICSGRSHLEILPEVRHPSVPNLYILNPDSPVGRKIADESEDNILLFTQQMTIRMCTRLLRKYQEDYERLSPLAQERVQTETFTHSELLRSLTVNQQIFQIVQLRDLRCIARIDLDLNGVIM